MKLYTESNPEGIEILHDGRNEASLWMDYMEWEGTLADGSRYVIHGNCTQRGWRYRLTIDGEQTRLLNDRSFNGKPPSAM